MVNTSKIISVLIIIINIFLAILLFMGFLQQEGWIKYTNLILTFILVYMSVLFAFSLFENSEQKENPGSEDGTR